MDKKKAPPRRVPVPLKPHQHEMLTKEAARIGLKIGDYLRVAALEKAQRS